jgi:hypothetical protein
VLTERGAGCGARSAVSQMANVQGSGGVRQAMTYGDWADSKVRRETMHNSRFGNQHNCIF